MRRFFTRTAEMDGFVSSDRLEVEEQQQIDDGHRRRDGGVGLEGHAVAFLVSLDHRLLGRRALVGGVISDLSKRAL